MHELCPLISVIVPAYNVEKYLDKCIASIVNQTYTNLEIILVDDGSTDNTPAICDSWAERDSRIHVIHKSNGGAGDSRNAALDIAKGELIGIVDSDDFIAPDMYERLYNLMNNNNADIAICRYKNFTGLEHTDSVNTNQDKNIEIVNGKEALSRLVMLKSPGLYGMLWNKLYKAELFHGVRFPKGNRHDDTARIHRLLGACNSIAITNDQLYFYRIHNNSVMGRISRQSFKSDIHMKHFQDTYEAFQDRGEYLRSINMNELAEFSDLRSKSYGVMTLMLQRLNYFRHRKEIKDLTGYSPSRLIIKLLFSKYHEIRLRGIKLLWTFIKNLLWGKNLV